MGVRLASWFLIAAVSLPMGNAIAQETWTLTVEHKSETSMEAGGAVTKVTETATGTIAVTVNPAREISGSGPVSAVSTMTVPGTISSRGTGQGPLTISGKRDNRNLYFSLHGTVKVTGETTITVPGVAAMKQPYESVLHGESVADMVVIERKDGGKVTNKTQSGPGLQPNTTITTTFTLSGGSENLGPPTSKVVFPDDPDIWTLEFEYSGSGAGGSWSQSMQGSADFPLPLHDGLVKGEGPLKVTHSPPPSSAEGKLQLDGQIKGGQLTFVLHFTFQGVTASDQAAFAGQMGLGQIALADDPKAGTTMPLKNGAEITRDVPVAGGTGTVTVRLKGHRREKWLVVIAGWVTSARGSGRVVFGPRVNWRMEVTVALKDGEYEDGSGKSSVGKIESFAKPPGLYTAKGAGLDYRTADGKLHPTPYVNVPTYPVSGTKMGSRTWRLGLSKAKEEPFLVVGFECVMNPQVAKTNGLDPGKFDKVWRDLAFAYYPLQAVVTLTPGWRSETGSSNAVDGQVITVTRLK